MLILLAAGAAMGFINNLAGAGGLIGLLAMDLAVMMDPTGANAAIRPAALAIGLSGLLGFYSKGHKVPLRAWYFGLAAIPGAVAGSVLALTLPEWVYQSALILVVLAVLGQQFRITPSQTENRRDASLGIGMLMFTLVGLHMGFLQVAVGLLIMLTLGRVHSRDLVMVNAAKTAIVICTAGASTLSLGLAEAIDWQPALWLATGAAIGSFTASRWSISKGHAAVRIVVLLVCLLVLIRILILTFA